MHLYNLSLQGPTAINQAITGSFSAPKLFEVVISRGAKILELLRYNDTTKNLEVVCSQEIFGLIRSITPYRDFTVTKDYVAVGSDSGRLVILEFDPEMGIFQRVHMETYGKTGCRRIVPGQYVAVDPKGRTIMVASIERSKFVYVLNRDDQKLTISSPKEAHKSNVLTFDVVALDVDYDNPLFACLEVDYGDTDNEDDPVNTGEALKMLTFYEFDIGQNCVTRKDQMPLHSDAHKLIPVPLKPSGPGGCLVCANGCVYYKKIGHPELVVPFPRRHEMPQERGVFVISSGVFKQKNMLFALLQTEMGDLFKLTLDYEAEEVSSIQLLYFGTIPPTNSLCILKNGHIFAASQFGNHALYSINDLGDKDPNPLVTTSGNPKARLLFNPKIKKNLSKQQEFKSLASVNDFRVVQPHSSDPDRLPKIYAVCGRGPYSSLRVLRQGITHISHGHFTAFPENVQEAWTLPHSAEDPRHKYMVISLQTRTCVLRIGTQVKEDMHSGFNDKRITLHAGMLADGSYIQVYHDGMLHLKSENDKLEWEAPKQVTCATSNSRQVAVALQGGEIIYFELNEFDQLNEVKKISLGTEIVSMGIPDVPEERVRAPLLAVGLEDLFVRIFSLVPGQCLNAVSYQAVPARPTSVVLIEMSSNQKASDMPEHHDILGLHGMQMGVEESQLFLYIGLEQGMLLRAIVDRVTGLLSNARARIIGTRPVKLYQTAVESGPAVLALSSHAWISYNYLMKYHFLPITDTFAQSAASFVGDKCRKGMVLFAGKTLRIVEPTTLSSSFTEQSVPLTYTPRKILFHQKLRKAIILETEHNIVDSEQRLTFKNEAAKNDQEYKEVPESISGYTRIGRGRWASKIRIVDCQSLQTDYERELKENEAVFAISLITFAGFDQPFLVVGKTKNMQLNPRSMSQAAIELYRVVLDHDKLVMILIHSTSVNDVPLSFGEYEGRLIAGIGSSLRVFDYGQKRLLLKCQNFNFQSAINNIRTFKNRIVCTDMADSFHVLKYRPEECLLYIFVDDIIPRWITTFEILDVDTLVGADKFGNIFVYRLPSGCDDLAEDDPTATKFKWENGFLNGAEFKLDLITHFHTGEMITAIKKTKLSPSVREVLLYSTSTGSLGVLLPFEKQSQVEFFVHLEMYMRQELDPLCGRDHMMFRSFYSPVKDVVDGDLCELYGSLIPGKQRLIAQGVDRQPAEIMEKLEEIKNIIL